MTSTLLGWRNDSIAPSIFCNSGLNKQLIILLCLLLAAITFALFLPAVAFDFINFDDPDYITRNEHIKPGLTWDNLKWAFENSHAGNWHPLTWLSHMLD